MAWLLNEIVGFISKAEEIAYYRQTAQRERRRAAKAGPEDRGGYLYEALSYEARAIEAEREGLDR
jgi:hypothetical protein